MTIIARRISENPADNGLTAVVERVHEHEFILRYWPRTGEANFYHECAIINFFETAGEAIAALNDWAVLGTYAVVLPDPRGKGWFIVVDSDGNHEISSRTIGNQNGYRTYHEAADALATMRTT